MEEQDTTFENVVNILGDLWLNYRNEPDLQEFFSFNDIGLPASYLIAEGLVLANEQSANYIYQTWKMLLDLLGLEDTGYESLEEILSQIKED